MERDDLERGLREILSGMEDDCFGSVWNCVADNLEEAHTQEEFLSDAAWALMGLCREAAEVAGKFMEYRDARYGNTARR